MDPPQHAQILTGVWALPLLRGMGDTPPNSHRGLGCQMGNRVWEPYVVGGGRVRMIPPPQISWQSEPPPKKWGTAPRSTLSTIYPGKGPL